MRNIEKHNQVEDSHRLARESLTNPFTKGRLWGKNGIHNMPQVSHLDEHDQMEHIKGDKTHYTGKGGRRKKTRKKRRRKNKRKTKRRKKTRRRKKRRKSNKRRRTKRR